MSAFLFGVIVMGGGVVAYAINHLLKPAGWAQPEPKPELAVENYLLLDHRVQKEARDAAAASLFFSGLCGWASPITQR